METSNIFLHKKLNSSIEKNAKITNNIPNDFNWKLYISLLNNSQINTNIKAYYHFNNVGLKNENIYKLYYRTVYNVPDDFIEESYIKYLDIIYNVNLNCNNYTNYKHLYTFYNKIGNKLYPLNDTYYKIRFDIPEEFDRSVYIKLYNNLDNNLEELNDYQLYNYYYNNKTTNYLTDEYYRIKYNITNDFSTEIYNKIHNLDFNNKLEYYKFYDSIGKHTKLLDDTYYKCFYNIDDDDFYWDIYLTVYDEDFIESDKNISGVYKHYTSKKYESISPYNLKYYSYYYKIKYNFNYENYYMYNKCFIFKNNDVKYAYKIYNKEVLLQDIYNNLIDIENTTLEQKEFIENYQYLISNFSGIIDEDDKRYYIYLKKFIQDYYLNSSKKETFKLISKNKTSITINYEPTEKVLKKERVVFNQNETMIETYEEKIIEYVKKNIYTITPIEVYERIYNSFDFYFDKSKINDIYKDLMSDTNNLYFTYRLKDYTDEYFITNKFDVLKTSDKHAIFFTFDNYPHIPITFKNNLSKLGKEWCHTIVCCEKNAEFVKNFSKTISENINVHILPYTIITHNMLNNLLLSTEFWMNFNSEIIIMQNENVYILDKITDFLNEDCLGYKLPNIFSYNNFCNGYGDFNIRKKHLILECLENINNIYIHHSLCKDIITHYTLDTLPEDIIYSFYIFNIANSSKIDPSIFFDKINDFNDNLLLVNYKIANIKTDLNDDINEFVKKMCFNKRKYLEKIFSVINV
uniref:DUF5672 domain-containing protein n=1 Tax=viral metagenome TaxID=1070528 RepID=A0A6C0EV00_9ZZZZ